MPIIDEQIGRNVARLRGRLSQKDLAAALRTRGLKWSQATVWKVETGERPLRLTEAVEIAAVLHTDVRLFFEPTGNVAWNEAYARLIDGQRAFKDAISAYLLVVAGVVSDLGDVELSDEQEEELTEEAAVTALDLVTGQLLESVATLSIWASAGDLQMADQRPFLEERLARIRRRFDPVIERWRNQAEEFDGADHGEHPEAP
ncbi:hypothetical protein C5D09_14825 [Rathayibacter sp. AY1C9]|uniref:helix-turn-helix domain-containing protein n=1 Tax=Rathayibacter sp. AY1C9 TaxID=2080541 RepID=UPI000CE72277|nr:helix-turn-helix transcriptional regulator [Rathayibacter sp. AY1C9]PPH43461.1 hypothetical protein C5D09_14825 [Rathayibacter sp. AY1C9]